MNMKATSRTVLAATMIAVGVIGLIAGGFAPIWRPVPENAPARELLANLSSFVSLACGAGLLFRRTAAIAALVLFVFLLAWTVLFKFPFIIRDPLEEVSYQSNGENAVLIAAAWILYAELAAKRRYLASDVGRRLAYLVYGLALVAFGLSHFFYLNMTAPLVPAWLPGQVFWAYATGSIYLACGLALIFGVEMQLAAIAAAVQITLITVLVWGPMLLTGDLSSMHWQETVVSWALTAASWVLATGSPPATAAYRLPFPKRR